MGPKVFRYLCRFVEATRALVRDSHLLRLSSTTLSVFIRAADSKGKYFLAARYEMKVRNFKPGDTVPTSGIYRVEHDAHRLMHEATLVEYSVFPQCRHCGTAVRFQLVRRIQTKRVLPFRSSSILEEFKQRKKVTPIAG